MAVPRTFVLVLNSYRHSYFAFLFCCPFPLSLSLSGVGSPGAPPSWWVWCRPVRLLSCRVGAALGASAPSAFLGWVPPSGFLAWGGLFSSPLGGALWVAPRVRPPLPGFGVAACLNDDDVQERRWRGHCGSSLPSFVVF